MMNLCKFASSNLRQIERKLSVTFADHLRPLATNLRFVCKVTLLKLQIIRQLASQFVLIVFLKDSQFRTQLPVWQLA